MLHEKNGGCNYGCGVQDKSLIDDDETEMKTIDLGEIVHVMYIKNKHYKFYKLDINLSDLNLGFKSGVIGAIFLGINTPLTLFSLSIILFLRGPSSINLNVGVNNWVPNLCYPCGCPFIIKYS